MAIGFSGMPPTTYVFFIRSGHHGPTLFRIDLKANGTPFSSGMQLLGAIDKYPVASSPDSLKKFRDRYPEGCLSADLVSVHDGQYIVRAVVSNQGTPLATGLGASVDVQLAEDKARDRAIALLGIQSDSAAKNSPPNVAEAQAETIQPEVSETNGHQVEVEQTDSAPDTHEEITVSLEPPEAELDPADDMGPPLDAIAEESAQPPAQPSAATIALENFSTSEVPVDLSDVIAQTDVELTRLGWTSIQGREYLEKNYGKRSRQQLTDEELMSFLLYLEEQ